MICVGSLNEVKVQAVREVFGTYTLFDGQEVVGRAIPSDVSSQPMSLLELITGARNRAEGAFYDSSNDYLLGVGIESGLFYVPFTKTGMMDICACSIFDGEYHKFGLSSAFECPPEVMNLIKTQGMEMNDAFHAVGLTENPKLGNSEGAVGLLTHGRVNRLDFTKQAIVMAMIHIDNPHLYKK